MYAADISVSSEISFDIKHKGYMVRSYLLGFDVGSSSVKASLVESDSGICIAQKHFPEKEAPIKSVEVGWAEQNPEDWWDNAKKALAFIMKKTGIKAEDIKAVGISYQMHGLVCVDKNKQVLRDAVIWCDSRAVEYGNKAFQEIGQEKCLQHLLNSPGNFTASKLKWVKENEPHIYERIYKIMLPGDYLAMRLSGEINTTICGLSEGIFWDFKQNKIADFLLDYYGFSKDILPDIVPVFSIQCTVSEQTEKETGLLKAGTPICYRAGDQPNNALSLNVFNPGEIASTAGTSGVVYGVSDKINYDVKSRVNTFAHVNHKNISSCTDISSKYDFNEFTRLGILLCINGTGILNSWLRHNVCPSLSYDEMNMLAKSVPVGSEGISILPFGNGAERVLENKKADCSIHGLNFNNHTVRHLIRAVQEGIVFSFCYGMEIMQSMGMSINKIHAGNANMFLSETFRRMLANTSGATIELFDTDGSVGAAKGAGIGLGIYKDNVEAFSSLKQIAFIEPLQKEVEQSRQAYERWKKYLTNEIINKNEML